MASTTKVWLAAGLLGLAGCIPAGYVKDPTPWVQEANWAEAQTLRLELAEYRLSPQVLVLREGRPYVLEIVNTGRETHSFSAPEFLKAVAARKAEVPEVAEVRAWRFTAFQLAPGRSVRLSFVAVRPGTYPVACTQPGHADRGMRGAVQIEKAPAGGD